MSTFMLFASLLALAAAMPTAHDMALHESLDDVPSGFVRTGRAANNATVDLRIALVQGDTDGLIIALNAVSNPSDPSYGKHLSKTDVEKLVAPSAESADAVRDWLSSNGIEATTLSPAGDWLGFSIPVVKANKLLGTDFFVYEHTGTGKEYIRTTEYSIPVSLKDKVDFVHPTVTFIGPVTGSIIRTTSTAISSRSQSDGGIDPSCRSYVTPSCLQALYGIPTTSATQRSNSLGVVGYWNEYANEQDLRSFLTGYRTDVSPNTTFTVHTLDNGANPQDLSKAGEEADLDIMYTVGLATGVPTTFYSVGTQFADGRLEGFLDIVNELLAEDAPPQVLTISYNADEGAIPQALALKMCNAYAQLGARGTSIVLSSGDAGVSGARTQKAHCTKFVPAFPSGCPYLTAVGATTGLSPERGADFSAGGFSNYFPAPAYQSGAVARYLSLLGDTNAGMFAPTGRAYPDVSAQGQNIVLYAGGQRETIDGTSAAAPIFASVIALLNDELIAAGKSPLGFLNPWLYSTAASAFTDVTEGSNPGCNTAGFPAKEGWDPITGLGTPNYANLRAAAGL